MCAWIVWVWSLSPSNPLRPDHAPIVTVIQSEYLTHSTSPRNRSAKHPASGCFGIGGAVIGSALSKGWRSGPEAFRAGHFFSRRSRFFIKWPVLNASGPETWPKPETAHEKPLAPRVSEAWDAFRSTGPTGQRPLELERVRTKSSTELIVG